MNKKEKRFVKTYSQGGTSGNEIWVDKETGINYFTILPVTRAVLLPCLIKTENRLLHK